MSVTSKQDRRLLGRLSAIIILSSIFLPTSAFADRAGSKNFPYAIPSMKNFPYAIPSMPSASAIPASAQKLEAIPGKDPVSIDRIHHPMRRLLVSNAVNCIGIPYKWGGTSRRGFDCSGFVQYVYDISGVELPRTAREQTSMTYQQGYLGPGDIVAFYPTNSPTRYHVGIYLGDGWFIHSPASGKKIRKERIDSPYFLKRFVGAWSPFTVESYVTK